MPFVMTMHWPEVSKEQYLQALSLVHWDREFPEGAHAHVAWLGNDGFHVIDVWDSPEQFQSFVAARLGPAMQQIGIAGEPKVEFHPTLGVVLPAAYTA